MRPKFSVIACRVFEDELLDALPGLENPPLDVLWFDVSLHVTPELMRAKLDELISRSPKEAEYILLLCGLCGNAVLGLFCANSTLVIPRMHECIAMFLGSNEKYLKLKKEKPRCYFASPGWLKSNLLPGKALFEENRAAYTEKYQDEELVDELMDAFAEQYASYNAYLYADFDGNAAAKKRCMENAEFMGWSFEGMRGDGAFFKDALECRWDGRFLMLPKGGRIEASYDERIFNG